MRYKIYCGNIWQMELGWDKWDEPCDVVQRVNGEWMAKPAVTEQERKTERDKQQPKKYHGH